MSALGTRSRLGPLTSWSLDCRVQFTIYRNSKHMCLVNIFHPFHFFEYWQMGTVSQTLIFANMNTQGKTLLEYSNKEIWEFLRDKRTLTVEVA